MRIWLFCAVLCCLVSPYVNAALRIGVQLEGQTHVEQFINNRPIQSITDYSGPLAYRDVIEQVLLLQALYYGGYDGKIEFVQADHYKRRLRLLEQGMLDLSVTAIWQSDALSIKESVFITSPLLRNGEAEAGFYTSEENKKATAVTELADLRQLHAISNQHWQVDWKIMSAIGFKHLDNVSQFTQMTDMIIKGRSDVMLAAFYNTSDLSFTQDGKRFVPIKGFKVKLPGSRHFVVSNSKKENKQVFEIIEKGLSILREKGQIEKAYRQSGFINHQVKDWLVIR